MLKRHEIEILIKAGHPKTEVARLAGVSARSVHRIAEENPVVDVNDSAERAQPSASVTGALLRGSLLALKNASCSNLQLRPEICA